MPTTSEVEKLEAEEKALRLNPFPNPDGLYREHGLQIILPELHDQKNGRIDAKKVAAFLGIPLKQFAEGLGLSYKAVHRNPSAPAWQTELQPVKRSLDILHEFFVEPAKIRAWLNTPHPLLEGKTSLAIILEGKVFAVERLLENAVAGVPA